MSKYRARSNLTLHYMPQTTTVDESNFALVVSNDPLNNIVGLGAWNGTGVAATPPNFATNKSSTNSVVFAGWSTWSREFEVDKSTEYYTSGNINDFIGSSTFIAGQSFHSQLRDTYAFAVSIAANKKADTDVDTPVGELYWEQSLEFSDFVPVATVGAIPWTLQNLLSMLGYVRFVAEEDIKELLEPDPPDPPPNSPADSKCILEEDEGVVIPLSPPAIKAESIFDRSALPLKKYSVNTVPRSDPPPPPPPKKLRASKQSLRSAKNVALVKAHVTKLAVAAMKHKKSGKLPKAAHGPLEKLIPMALSLAEGTPIGPVVSAAKALYDVPGVKGLIDSIASESISFLKSLWPF